MIRCFVQGAQGVGKSTLINSMEHETISAHSVRVVTEVARELIKEGVGFDSKVSPIDHCAYYYKNLHNFRIATGDIILFDRSIIDVITFSRILSGRNNWVEKLGKEIFQLIQKDISLIVYLPIEFTIRHDDIRKTTFEEQSSYDRVLLEIMHELDIKYYTLNGDLTKRKNKLKGLLQNLI